MNQTERKIRIQQHLKTKAEHTGGAPLNSVQAKLQHAEAEARERNPFLNPGDYETPSELQAALDEQTALDELEPEPLREVRVIVGTLDQAGRDQIDNLPYNVFELSVAELAGGFTLTHGAGAWVDPDGVLISEPARIYDIAIAPRNQQLILHFAITLGRRTDQHSIYFRNTDGVVGIVEV